MRQIISLRHPLFVIAVMAIAGAASSATAQEGTFRRIADLNSGSVGSFPTNLTVFADSLYFSAYTLQTGRELWRYNGSNIVLATNINDTADDIGSGVLEGNDSIPDWLTEFDKALCFSAFDPRRGGELWHYDGTNGVRVADINPDANDMIKSNPKSSWPRDLTVVGSVLYFAADSGAQVPNYELWKYDGAAAALVTNIHLDIGADHSSYPIELTAFDSALYFMADDGVNGFELWKHRGTSTVMLSNINPGDATSSSFPKSFTPFNNELYFQAFDSSTGYELWKTDGSAVLLVTNLSVAGSSSFPEFLTVFNNALYFRATDGVSGFELWKYDGRTATLISNINATGDLFPKNLTVFGETLYFAADDGIHGWELWKYDGTSASLVSDLNASGDSFPESLTVFNGGLYFVATTPGTGYELWKYDGSTVTLAADMNPGSGSSFPRFLAVCNHELCFSAAEDGFSNWELWALSSGNLPPTVTITSPLNGSSFIAPANIALNAEAQDFDGTIAKVEFFQGAIKIGEAIASPYTLTWSNVSAGDFTLRALANDDRGTATTSDPVTISVTNGVASPVTLDIAAWIGGSFVFSFASEPGITYQAQYIDVLGSGSWQALTTVTGTGSTLTLTNNHPAAGQRFYRVETK